MSTTFTSLTYHIVFSTKYRRNWILPEFQERLYEYKGGVIRSEHGALLEIGGIADHVHLLTGFPPTVALSDMVRMIKANASRWLNELPGRRQKFAWQTGYGAFTVSQSQVAAVRRYIQCQEEHHRRMSFREEFLAILKRHQIQFDPKYVFEVEHHG